MKKTKVWIGIFVPLILLNCSPVQDKTEGVDRNAVNPNIIFLLADDLRDNMFSIDGHPQLNTPNIDQLIEKGTRFRNAYIAEPVCAPSRVSLLTGLPERLHGVGFSSSYQLTEQQWGKTYPAMLRKNGYFTGFIGKIGVEYYTFIGNMAEKFDFWYGHDGWTKFFPKEYDSPSCVPYHGAEKDIITPIMTEGIYNFLDSIPEDKPFCLSVSFNVPHGSQTTSMYTGYEGWHTMIKPANENPALQGHPVYDTLFRSANIKIPEATGTDPYRYIPQAVMDQDKGRNKTYDYDYTRETCLEHHIRYYQTITGLDMAIGKMRLKLEEKGMADNTIIIFASDHGLLMGEYGMGGKALLYDLTSKIPCFIYDPTVNDSLKGKKNNNLVSSLDIPATILDYAGIAKPDQMEGHSLKPLVAGKNILWRDEIFLESLFTLRDNPFCEGIRLGNWKYIRMYDGVNPYLEKDLDFTDRPPVFEQLFNLQADPAEEINLIDQYRQTEFLQQLREKVSEYSNELNKRRQEYTSTNDIIRKETEDQ